MRRYVTIATVVASLAVVLSAQAAPAPKIVTLRNNGATLTTHKGAQLQLHLSERYHWVKPRVRGTALRLVPIAFIRDPGYQAWAVIAQARGKTVVTAVGYGKPGTCDPGVCSPHLFRVTFVVR